MTVIYPQSPEFLKTVRKLAKKGYTDKKIARSVGFPPKFFARLVRNIPELSEVLRTARKEMVSEFIREHYAGTDRDIPPGLL